MALTANLKSLRGTMKRYILFSLPFLLTGVAFCAVDPDLPAEPNSQMLSEAQKTEALDIISEMIEANRYWLVSPPDTVRNYEYKFEILITNSKPFKPVIVEVNDPSKAKSSQRKGIAWYSVLHRIAFDPNVLNITALACDDNNIRIDFYLNGMPAIQCGNGISNGFFGSFGGGSTSDDKISLWGDEKVFGTLWLNSSNYLPEKVQFSTVIERFLEFTEVDNTHWVPLRVKVDNEYMHWDLHFALFKPGLWLFDQSGYTLDTHFGRDNGLALPVAAATSEIKINDEPFSKPGPDAVVSRFAVQIDPAQIQRATSQLSLEYLGLVLTGHAKYDPNGLFPDSLSQLQSFERQVEEWSKHFIYLGKDKCLTDTETIVLAYDKSLLENQDGTNVLFSDGTVEFFSKDKLTEFGINP
jgi:hypothetical protein